MPNRNLRYLRQAASEMGAAVLQVDDQRRRHTIVHLRTQDGRRVRMTLSRYRMDPYILKGWLRQKLTNPAHCPVTSMLVSAVDQHGKPLLAAVIEQDIGVFNGSDEEE